MAIQDRGDTSLDKINKVLKYLEDGKIDPQTARVIIDTEKWKASRFYPKLYGDKTEIELNSTSAIFQKIYISETEEKRINNHIDAIVDSKD